MLKNSIREFNNVYFKTEWKEANPFFNLGLTMTTGTLVDISYIWFIIRDEDGMHSVWQHPKLSVFFPASTVYVSYMCNIVKYWQDRMESLEKYCMNTAIQSLLDWFYVEASCQSGEMTLQSKRGSWKLLQARAGISTIVRLQSPTNALADMWLLLKTVTLIPF